jgi:hypothetical protein
LSLIVNLVDDAVIAHSDTPTVGVASQFGHTVRLGLILQGPGGLVDAGTYFRGGSFRRSRSAAGRSRTL